MCISIKLVKVWRKTSKYLKNSPGFQKFIAGFKRKPHFFFFLMMVSVKLWQEICGFTFLGVQKLKPRWFHWNQGFRLRWRPKAAASIEYPWFQWIPPWFSIFDTPKNVKSTDFLSKFHWIPSFKIKKICEVLFEISF